MSTLQIMVDYRLYTSSYTPHPAITTMTLNNLLDDYLNAVLKRNPQVATLLGVHDYDTLPTDTHSRQASSFSEIQ